MDTSLMEYLAENALEHLRKAGTLPAREAEQHVDQASEFTGLNLKLMARSSRNTPTSQLPLPLKYR